MTRKSRRVERTEDWEQLELLCAWDEQREYERIGPLVLFGEPVPERAAETGTSERTLYRRIAGFEENGVGSLFGSVPAKRRVLPASLRRLIVDLKAEHSALNLNEIANTCHAFSGRKPNDPSPRREGPMPRPRHPNAQRPRADQPPSSKEMPVTEVELEAHYRRYISCLNNRRLDELDEFVHEELTYNGEPETRADYRARIAGSVAAIPDLYFDVQLLVVGGDQVGCRLFFNCTPQSEWLGLRPNGGSISFSEHVFYKFRGGKIYEVWSLLDVPSIVEQLS